MTNYRYQGNIYPQDETQAILMYSNGISVLVPKGSVVALTGAEYDDVDDRFIFVESDDPADAVVIASNIYAVLTNVQDGDILLYDANDQRWVNSSSEISQILLGAGDPNGLATLDEDGNLRIEQIPPGFGGGIDPTVASITRDGDGLITAAETGEGDYTNIARSAGSIVSFTYEETNYLINRDSEGVIQSVTVAV